MTAGTTERVTLEQLARLFDAARQANRGLDAARRMRPRDPEAVEQALRNSRTLNSAYDAALRQYKRQQKAERRGLWRTTMTRFYLDYREAV